MKFGVDVRRVAYQDLESFGGADDFGAFTFDRGIFTGNAFANLLLGLPTKTYVAQSGPDVHAHTIQTGVYAQDEFRVNDRLTLTYGLRWQALPAFDVRNGGIILPVGNQPRPGFLATINSCNSADPNNSVDPCGTPTAADTALGCVPVLGAALNMPCAPVEYANKIGLGPGLRQFYEKNFQPRLGFAYRPFGNSKTVVRGGFGIFTMTNLGCCPSTPPTSTSLLSGPRPIPSTTVSQPTNSPVRVRKILPPRLLVPVISTKTRSPIIVTLILRFAKTMSA